MPTPGPELHPDYRRPTGPADLYTTKPPWDIDRPQPAFATLAESGEIRGQVLDIGCGTGEHAMLAARLGLTAVGIDQSAQALEQAERKARERGLDVRFHRHDALALAELGETFDTVLDCGLFHIFDSGARGTYLDSLAAVLRPGGRYFMLGFSDRQPGTWGPHRLSRTDIETAFGTGWRLDSLTESTIEILAEPTDMAAWLAARHPDLIAMPTLEARISTDRPDRYLSQFCKHADAMSSPRGHRMRMHRGNPLAAGDVRLRVDRGDTHTTIHFDPWGRCTLHTESGLLLVHIDAADDIALQRIRDTLTRDLDRFARGQLTIDWHAADDHTDETTSGTP